MDISVCRTILIPIPLYASTCNNEGFRPISISPRVVFLKKSSQKETSQNQSITSIQSNMFFRRNVYEPFGGVPGGSSLFYRPKQRRRQEEMRRTERARQAAAMRQEMDEERRRNEMRRDARSGGAHGAHQFVRGLDGRVYRLVPRAKQTRGESMRSNISDDRSDDDSMSSSETWRDCMDCSASRDGEDVGFGPARRYAHEESQSQQLREVVIVEDVSEDELLEDDELRELRSVWRNRRPSPGLLMEPVEMFRRN